jgi:NADH-quinone oxidoreductase subunit N
MNVDPIISYPPAEFYLSSLPLFILVFGSLVAMLQSVSQCWGECRHVRNTAYISVVSALISVVWGAGFWADSSFLNGSVSLSAVGYVSVLLILMIAVATLLMANFSTSATSFFRGEIISLFLAVLVGMVTVLSAGEFITFFVGIEMVSIAIYALVGYIQPTRKSQEGAVKYLILGSFASGFLLFGLALIYAHTGSMQLGAIGDIIAQGEPSQWLSVGALMFITGIGFKMALVPFHMWAPDVYESAPSYFTSFMATAVKVLVMGFLCKAIADGWSQFSGIWIDGFLFLAGASLIVGNTMGLVQTSLKRMLAYSSIGHSGYLIMAIAASTTEGVVFANEAVMFYLASYSLVTVAAFSVLTWLETAECQNLNLDDISGLSGRHPKAAALLAICMFSFGGLPPTIGFISKYLVFSAAISSEHYVLIVVAALASTVGLYYYLRVIVKMYMTPACVDGVKIGDSGRPQLIWLAAAAMALVLLAGTIWAGPSIQMIRQSLKSNSTIVGANG